MIKIGDFIVTADRRLIKITGQNKNGLYGRNANGHLYPICAWVEKVADPAKYLVGGAYDDLHALLESNAWPEVADEIRSQYLFEITGKIGRWNTYKIERRI